MQKKKNPLALTNKGFTLAELLLTILILSLAGIAMISGFIAIQHSYQQITQKANAETLLSTTSYKINSYLRYAEDIAIADESDIIHFTDPNSGFKISFSNDDKDGILVSYTNETHQLLSDDTMTDKLIPKLTAIKQLKNLISYDIEIYNQQEQLITNQAITIKLINHSPELDKQ